jgi:maltose alpha-D-glucosyltransferase/alpha-amylase
VIFGDSAILKVLRRIAPGVHPDLELGRYLTETARFENVAPVMGAIEYKREKREPITLAVLQGFVPNEGDAWKYTSDSVSRYFHEGLSRREVLSRIEPPEQPPLALADAVPPPELSELLHVYLESIRLLGRRTAELHLALGSCSDLREIAPQPFDMLYQRSLYQLMRSRATQTITLLGQRLRHLPESVRSEAREVVGLDKAILKRFASLIDGKITGSRTRIHGDYHLGQVLYTGKDFVIIDFEGEPDRPLSERRLKRSPLRDVAGMLRSFQYAVYAQLLDPRMRTEDVELAGHLAKLWIVWVSAAYLGGYSKSIAGSPLLPKTNEEMQVLLDAFLLNKCLYEIGYELNNRPDWVRIPVRGVLDLVGERI